ncbi:MAG: 3,4-dioxygenase subunit beta [Actinomycetota bacterium]|nr:3,4-dioxygenase subunit beta [Actinomycetota bacterium]
MRHRDHHHDEGLAFDLSTLLDRRRALKLLAGAGVLAVAGCASDGDPPARSSPSTAGGPATTAAGSAAGATGDCETIPRETPGPFPGDGSNGPDVLSQSGIVRSDITSSFGSASGVADGVPLTVNLTVLDQSKACAARAGAAVYVWQCDREGRYSLYSEGATDQNYLRGVQVADANGVVTFRSIFPAAYPGRWPHIHFEVYPNLPAATGAGTKLATSQLALPGDVCEEVYASAGYGTSGRTLAQTSLTRDNVFRDDGGVRQLATVSGDLSSGLVANLSVPV